MSWMGSLAASIDSTSLQVSSRYAQTNFAGHECRIHCHRVYREACEGILSADCVEENRQAVFRTRAFGIAQREGVADTSLPAPFIFNLD